MSLLAEFAGGFTGDLHRQGVAAQEEQRLMRIEAKREMARRAAEAAARKEARKDRKEERQFVLENTRMGEGFNPATGLIEWRTGNGEMRSAQATPGEIAQYQAAAAQSALAAEKEAANMALIRARTGSAERANRPENRSGGGRTSTESRPVLITDTMALQIVGALKVDDIKRDEEKLRLFKEIRGSRLTPEEIDDLRDRLANRTSNDAAILRAASAPNRVVFDQGDGTNSSLLNTTQQYRDR